MLGILLIDKGVGPTSHDIVHGVRKKLGVRRVGHAGTLDPLASGLLVLGVGPATRVLNYLPLEPKVYEVESLFGIETDTQDAMGTLLHRCAVPQNLSEVLAQTVPSFLGRTEQIPPLFSAVKVDGKPLYSYARKGMPVSVQSRPIEVKQWEILGVKEDKATFRIVCSGGTYIRTLVHDLAIKMGTRAHVTALRRTKVGDFRVEDAVSLQLLTAQDLLPLEQTLGPTNIVQLSQEAVSAVRNGRPIANDRKTHEGHVGWTDEEGRFVGIGRIEGTVASPQCILPWSEL